MAIMNDDDELQSMGMEPSDLGFGIANTNRKRRIFEPYEESKITPENEYSSQYESHLGAMPQREAQSTKDKILTMLVGGLTGFTEGPSRAISQVRNIQDRPYEQAIQSWKMKGAGLEDLANIEERKNRTALGQSEAHNRYLKDVNELMMRQGNYDSLAEDREADNARADSDSEARAADFASEAEHRKAQEGIASEGLSLERGRLADAQERTNIERDRESRLKAGEGKTSSPAEKDTALKSAALLIKTKYPQLDELMQADIETLTPEQQQARSQYLIIRDKIAAKLMNESGIPEVDEMKMPEKSEPKYKKMWDSIFGRNSNAR